MTGIPAPKRGLRFVHPRYRVPGSGKVATWGYAVRQVTRVQDDRVYHRDLDGSRSTYMTTAFWAAEVRMVLRARPDDCPVSAWDGLCRAVGNHGRPVGPVGPADLAHVWLLRQRLVVPAEGSWRVSTAGHAVAVVVDAAMLARLDAASEA